MKRIKRLDPIINRAVEASFKDGKILEPEVSKLMNAFTRREAPLKKLSRTEAIYSVSGYLKGLKREIAKHTLVVESAVLLSKGEMSEIKKHLKQLTIADEQLTVNSSLLGGMRIKIADTVYDLSLRSKLNQVKEAIRG